MGAIYGGHLVAKYLKEREGITTVFGLCGGHIDRILDGFLEYRVRFIDVRHEQAAVMMAHAWSVLRAEPSVCLVTAGPGFTNAISGIVSAYFDNAPVVVLSGTAPLRDRDKGALQDMNHSEMIKSAVKWTGSCNDPKRIPEYLATAIRHAVSGRPGPVFLELPPDTLNVKIDEEEAPYPNPGRATAKTAPNPMSIESAASLINSSERPVLMGGSGIAFSDCDTELKDFVGKTGMPFVFLNHARGAIDDSHPLSLWNGSHMAVVTALSQADLVIALGIRFNLGIMLGQIFPQAKLIKVDIDPTEMDRNRMSDIGLVGDIGLALQELNRLVKPRDLSGWVRSLHDAYGPLIQDEMAQREQASEPIHPARLVELVRRVTNDDVIYSVDGGDTSYFAIVGLKVKEKGFLMAGSLFGCLGAGIPWGIGAKLARPDKNVVVVSGDGSLGFNIMEYDTAVRHAIPLVCVVVNDQAWGMIKHGQELSYGANRLVGSELGVVHYEKVVEALGGHGELVQKDKDIMPALSRAINSGKPALVNVLTDPTVTSPATLMLGEGLKME
ncbi:MAG: thiamine pyrophosphate-binding protein [Dehalococcoidia bacterium]|nr:MAG: thiamine pyrophosphate-binding protein [Dehalococcoidia bacterium]